MNQHRIRQSVQQTDNIVEECLPIPETNRRRSQVWGSELKVISQRCVRYDHTISEAVVLRTRIGIFTGKEIFY